MIHIRSGNYCFCFGQEFELIQENTRCKLIFRGVLNSLIKELGFKEYRDQIYTLDTSCSEINHAYHVETFCHRNGLKFYIEKKLENGNYRIWPVEDTPQKKTGISARHGFDPVYEVSEIELSEIWEERTPIEGFNFNIDRKIILK